MEEKVFQFEVEKIDQVEAMAIYAELKKENPEIAKLLGSNKECANFIAQLNQPELVTADEEGAF